ncbi:unnamed protein product [Closterium sp. NIES-65]|nr:unnamed protein product [Closterium sp. NIES-65]
MQRSDLRLVLAAALAALILSACAPRAAEALRLACTDRSCGANARCLKSVAGWADCVCDRGFKLLPNASCARELTFPVTPDCGEKGYCEEVQGRTTCRCNTGFAKTAGGCVVREGRGRGGVVCVCDAGFTLRDDGKSCAAVVLPPAASNRRYPRGQEKDAEGNCVVSAPTCVSADVCTVRNCGPNSRCLKNEAGWANCVCERGLKLLPNASCAHSCARRDCGENACCEKEQERLLFEVPQKPSLSCCCSRAVCAFSHAVPPTDSCAIRDCGENAYCEKEQELAVCHCNWGYAMTDTGCVDTCILQACGENGRCVKDEAGMASCVCDVGFTLMGDGRTCTDNCILKRCQALTSDCMKYEDGTAYCVCKPGYTLLYGTCVGPATCGNCPSLATCTLVSSTRKAPYCVCPAGFGMTATGCVRGALPTVSSASLTFYNQPGLTLTPSTYTLRVRYSRCTNLPSTIGLNVRSYWRVDRAPGGAGHCQFVNAYRFANCVTQVAQLPALSLSGIAAASVS